MKPEEKFMLKKYMNAKKELEQIPFYKYSVLKNIHRELSKCLDEIIKSKDNELVVEEVQAEIQKELDSSPSYLYTPYPVETDEGKKLKSEKKQINELEEKLKIYEKFLSEKLLDIVKNQEVKRIIGKLSEES